MTNKSGKSQPKKSNKIIFFVGLVIFISCAASFAKEPSITAQSAIIYDVSKNKVIYSKEPDRRLPAASTIKLMTAILAMENYKDLKSKSFSVTQSAIAGLPYNLLLNKGAEYKIDDLLAAMLMSSANDAANVIAEAVSGTKDDFVKKMNSRAAAIGLSDTKFANPNGLSEILDSQYSTANDMCKLMQRFLEYQALCNMLKPASAVIQGSDGKKVFLKNHNKLIKRYPHVIIGKTGYTLKARHCFVGVSLVTHKSFIFVILGSSKPWKDMSKLLLHAGCIKKVKRS